MRYCEQVASDWGLFNQALTLLGPTLGVDGDAGRTWTADWKVLFAPMSDPRTAGVDPVTGPITINEICATGSEYVELTNPASPSQNLADLSLADADVDGGPRFEKAVRFAAGTVLARGARLVIQGGVPTPRTGLQTKCMDGVKRCYEASWDVSGGRGETIYLLSHDDVVLDQALTQRTPPQTGRAGAGCPTAVVRSPWGRRRPTRRTSLPSRHNERSRRRRQAKCPGDSKLAPVASRHPSSSCPFTLTSVMCRRRRLRSTAILSCKPDVTRARFTTGRVKDPTDRQRPSHSCKPLDRSGGEGTFPFGGSLQGERLRSGTLPR